MRSRFPLLLKKRGGRRTGSPLWALSGELLYHGVFVAVGVVACWWHVANVLVPDWLRRQATVDYVEVECEVVESDVAFRDGAYTAVWTIRLLEPPTDEAGANANQVDSSFHSVTGPAQVTRQQAERTQDRYAAGDRLNCWVDPEGGDRVVLNRGLGVWPWLVLLIPASLAVIGGLGLSRAALRTGVSNERRHAVAQQAGRFDPFSSSRVSVATATALPSSHDVDDSPGVKHRYRLPIDGAASWRLAGMTVMCVAWNVLVGFFLVGVVTDHLHSDRPNWALTIVVAPLAVAGGWLAYSLLRDARAATGVGLTQVEIANHPLILGQTSGGVVFQAGQFRARSLSVSLVCDELATYCEGTDTRISTEEVYRQTLHSQRRVRVEADRPYEQPFTFTVPSDAMHSFTSPHNEVRWSIEVRGAPIRWPEFRRRFRLCVYPANFPPAGQEFNGRYDAPPAEVEAPA